MDQTIDNVVEDWPAVQYFEMGTKQWRSAQTWPPPSKAQDWYVGGDVKSTFGTLTLQSQTEVTQEQYIYNPHNPLPTLWAPQLSPQSSDRIQLGYREDVLRYRSEALTESVTIAGNPEVTLFVASSARDTDVFVWLVDEAPDGTALEISSSDFPNFDRNHNTGGNDLRESTLQSAEQTILHGGDFSACISLPRNKNT